MQEACMANICTILVALQILAIPHGLGLGVCGAGLFSRGECEHINEDIIQSIIHPETNISSKK